MKILVTSDIHNDPSLVKKLIDTLKKEKPDLLVLLGDLGEYGEIPEGFFKRILNYIGPYRVLFVPGNHETPEVSEFWERLYKIRSLHNKIFEIYDLAFVGIGGGDLPLFMISDSEIRSFLEYVKKKVKDKRIILLTHVHPRYTTSSLVGGGSIELYRFIKENKPLLALHGHIHEAGGLENIINKTRVINVARTLFLIEIRENNINVKKIA